MKGLNSGTGNRGKASFTLFLLFIFISCVDEVPDAHNSPFTLVKLGLEGVRVNEMLLKGNSLYAMTSKGLYVRDINTKAGFRLVGFEDRNIEDIVVISGNEILASFRDITDFSELDPKLYKTVNGGESWQEIESNFGGGEFTEGLHDFEVHPNNPNLIYGTGNRVIAKSDDFGITWETVWGDWQMFSNRLRMAINPQVPDEIWAGGQGAFEDGYLVHLKEENEVRFWNELVPNPSVVKEIVFDNLTPQSIYVGWEGEIAKSTDNGASWETLIDRHEEAHFFMGIGISQNDPNLVFTGKWIKTDGKQDLELFYSFDKGNNWEVESFNGVDFGGVFDMKVKSEPGKERIFVGLDKGGVYEIIMTGN